MNQLYSLFQESKTSKEYAHKYLNYLTDILKSVDTQHISQVIECFELARDQKKNIFIIGNGGSATTASHFANDLRMGTKTYDRPYQAFSLTDNIATITATANDYGYDNLFLDPLKTRFCKGDLLVALSASGNSLNILKAVHYVNQNEGTSIGFTGFDGGELKSLCHHSVHVKSFKGEYGPVEDVHLMIAHLITSYLMLRESRDAPDSWPVNK